MSTEKSLPGRSVRIFDVKEGGVQTVCADLRGHEGPVWQVAWANPKFGNILASCSYDRKVINYRSWTEEHLVLRCPTLSPGHLVARRLTGSVEQAL